MDAGNDIDTLESRLSGVFDIRQMLLHGSQDYMRHNIGEIFSIRKNVYGVNGVVLYKQGIHASTCSRIISKAKTLGYRSYIMKHDGIDIAQISDTSLMSMLMLVLKRDSRFLLVGESGSEEALAELYFSVTGP